MIRTRAFVYINIRGKYYWHFLFFLRFICVKNTKHKTIKTSLRFMLQISCYASLCYLTYLCFTLQLNICFQKYMNPNIVVWTPGLAFTLPLNGEVLAICELTEPGELIQALSATFAPSSTGFTFAVEGQVILTSYDCTLVAKLLSANYIIRSSLLI